MDPSKRFEFHLDHNRVWWKIKLTLGILLFNSLATLMIIAIACYAVGEAELRNIVKSYIADNRKIYLSELNSSNILRVIRYFCIDIPILEEYMFRYPFILLLKNHLRVRLWRDLTNASIITLALALGLLWGYGHDNLYASIPIFVSSIPLYWLVAKTRCLWPSIACHAASNFLLYILAQFLIYEGVLERIVP